MKLFYHHVGLKGANEDFRKTVFDEVQLSFVDSQLKNSSAFNDELLFRLTNAFPSKKFNCWGVPTGAKSVISNLETGDVVLLVKTTAGEGSVPVLCKVEVFVKSELESLSKALWGSDKYPYIFFFNTKLLELTWDAFSEQIGYSANFNPRGQFYLVAESRLTPFGGVERYIDYLQAAYSLPTKSLETVSTAELINEVGAVPSQYVRAVEKELHTVEDASSTYCPELVGNLRPKTREITLRPRSAAFRIAIKKLYNYRCAICGVRLFTPSGQPEVESAHIYPKELDGNDDLRNGICLCRLHHWALDAGWLSLADNYKVIVRNDLPPTEDYEFIRVARGREISLPAKIEFAPHPLFMRAHRTLKGFDNSYELTDEEFYEFAEKHEGLRIERNADGEINIMAPTGGETSDRNAEITMQLRLWAKQNNAGPTFDSSGGFSFPNGATYSPDAAWIERSRWESLNSQQRRKFIPIVPDFIIELRSASDSLRPLQAKMQEYLDLGVRLAWLIDPLRKRIYKYSAEAEMEIMERPNTISGEPILHGFTLDLREIW